MKYCMLEVSVCLITYNHEKYIAEAIQSILDQTFKNFELIIINDGSTDKTEQIIKSFQDHRIRYMSQENQGPSVALNNAILSAEGKYIALMSGDDVCYPERFEKQYNFLANTPDNKIIFSQIDFIDDSSNLIKDKGLSDIFNKIELNSRGKIFHTLFFKGNCFNAPTCMVEKKLLMEEGLFNLALIQSQDYDMWFKLIKKYDLYLMPEKLLKYRIRDNQMNLSHGNKARSYFEMTQMFDNVLDDISLDFYKKVFCQEVIRKDFFSHKEFELEKAFLLLKHPLLFIHNLGIQKLFRLLQDKEILSIANEKYDFGLSQLYQLTANDPGIKMQFNSWQEKFYKLKRTISNDKLTFKKIIKMLSLLAVMLAPSYLKQHFRFFTRYFKQYL